MFSKGGKSSLEPDWLPPLNPKQLPDNNPSRKDKGYYQVCLVGGKSSGNQFGFQKINPPYNWNHTVPG